MSTHSASIIGRKVVLFTLLLLGFFWLSKSSTVALLMPQSTKGNQLLSVIVTPQEGSPLHIVSTWVASREPKQFKLIAQVQNKSGKEIRAYAINSQTATNTQQNGLSQFMNLTRRSELWHPTEVRAIEFSDPQVGQIESIRLTIDFVEFDDGTTWGPDTQNSRDILAGQREGARLEKQRLHKLLQDKGREALVDEILRVSSIQVDIAVRNNHSPQRFSGYRSGVSAVHRHLMEALRSRDKDAIDSELIKEFDTSEVIHK